MGRGEKKTGSARGDKTGKAPGMVTDGAREDGEYEGAQERRRVLVVSKKDETVTELNRVTAEELSSPLSSEALHP